MKLLRIQAKGLPLFKQELDLIFYARQRVNDIDKDSLYSLSQNIYLNTANAFIGVNASGKTSIMKVIQLSLAILNNEPVNHCESRQILGNAEEVNLSICFYAKPEKICRLETVISSRKGNAGTAEYFIKKEKLWEKSFGGIKKTLTDFTGINPVSERNTNEKYLSEDVSFIIARNKEQKESVMKCSLLSYTNTNVLPFTEDIPYEVITFLDPTIERLSFKKDNTKTFIHLKFFGEEEIILNNAKELEEYLSSGTIKGIITFSMVKEVLKSGGYLLVDEIENHFNKEIVMTLIRFFMDSSLNRNGGILIFTTHYPEILDEYNRNDSINIVRNRNSITSENLSNILTRNDIKKSDAYQSGFLQGTTPAYEAYMKLKKFLDASI